jgi:MYXO-CTERM domain-containing protein
LILAMLGCQSSRPPEPISQSAQPIVGGSQATTCQWPSTVMMVGSVVCSGALVHPRAVVTAKHCLMDQTETTIITPSAVGFGESRNPWAKTVNVSRCFVHPTNDMGLCLLAEDVTDIPIIPVMAPCETSALLPGKPIVEVGFGLATTTGRNYGTKRWIDGTIESRSASLVDILVTTGSQDGEYFGDSGGPLFFQMPDQTWRLIGEDCCSDDIRADAGSRISTYTSVPYHVDWMEEQSGLDLTPCHDPGGWNPDARCTGFPTNPGAGVGTWAGLCQGETMVRSQTCALSTYDAGSDTREAGGRDAAPEVTADVQLDGTPGDGPLDGLGVDGLGNIADGLDTRADGFETGEPPMEGDAMVPRVDVAEPDSAIPEDALQIPGDSGMAGLDASTHEVRPEVGDSAGVADSRTVEDAAAGDTDQREGDSAVHDQPPGFRGGGCSCRTGVTQPTGGWALLVAFGLVGAAGRSIRRRPSQAIKTPKP